MQRQANTFSSDQLQPVLNQAASMISDSDLQLCHLALDFATALLRCHADGRALVGFGGYICLLGSCLASSLLCCFCPLSGQTGTQRCLARSAYARCCGEPVGSRHGARVAAQHAQQLPGSSRRREAGGFIAGCGTLGSTQDLCVLCNMVVVSWLLWSCVAWCEFPCLIAGFVLPCSTRRDWQPSPVYRCCRYPCHSSCAQ